jgi:hypothetical protein
MKRMGCTMLVRGHEKVDEGFLKNYDDENITLITLFSAGGEDNGDLPPDSSYRSVTPKSMTVTYVGDDMTVAPWTIDYKTYNDPSTNAFFKRAPEIEHRK